jgi:hypothetical protein
LAIVPRRARLTWLATLDHITVRHQYAAARPQRLLGQPERAVELLRQARNEGLPAPRHPDPTFAKYADFPPLLAFFRPEG